MTARTKAPPADPHDTYCDSRYFGQCNCVRFIVHDVSRAFREELAALIKQHNGRCARGHRCACVGPMLAARDGCLEWRAALSNGPRKSARMTRTALAILKATTPGEGSSVGTSGASEPNTSEQST